MSNPDSTILYSAFRYLSTYKSTGNDLRIFNITKTFNIMINELFLVCIGVKRNNFANKKIYFLGLHIVRESRSGSRIQL